MKLSRSLLLMAVAGVFARAAVAADSAPTVGDVMKRSVEVRTGVLVAPDAERARKNYEAFLALSSADDALRADAMRRLADLRLEAGEEERIGQELASGAPLPTRDAIALYSRLLEAVPDYPHADAVYYQLSRAYDAAGDEGASVKALESLISRFPRSGLAAEAEFRRGEYFFSKRRWADAESAYQTMLEKFPSSDFVEQATYKLGWARFKSGDNDGALDAFVRLLDRELVATNGREKEMDSFSRPQRELLEDTLRVSALIFSAEDGTTGIDKFLARVGRKPYEDHLFATLGDLYASKERWTDAAGAYRGFAKLSPWHERAPILQSVAIDAYRRGGFTQLVLAAKQDYVEQYGTDAPYWSHHSAADMPLVLREVKQNLQDVAAYYHERAQASKLASDYQDAARWYREYLKEFPKDDAAAETAYLLSDALFESRQYSAAADEYLKVAYDLPSTSRSATAAYAAVVAFEKQEALSAGDERAKLHALSLEAGLRFATAFPDHPESGAVLVRVARQRLEDRDFAAAVSVAAQAVDRQPALPDRLLQDALLVSANGEFELGHFDLAEKAGIQLLRLIAPADGRRAAIEERVAASIYRQGEIQRDAGRQLEAAQTFLRVARVVPNSPVRETAMFDAAAAWLAAEQWPQAIEVLEQYRKDYPRSERQPEVTRRLAAAYLAAKDPLTAAKEFERIASLPGGDAGTQREALLQAAELYDKAGNGAAAASARDVYVHRFPEPFSAALEVRQKLADYARSVGNASKRAAILEELVRVEAAAGAQRDDRSRSLAAQASLELATPLRDAFFGLRLTSPLKKSLEAKRAALQKALHEYEKADAYAVEDVSTSATYEMAELYRRLAQDLLKAERPKNLSPDALEQFGLLLEEQAFPFEEKAIALHEINAARVISAGLYNDSVRRSMDALSEMKPARYGKLEAPEELSIDMIAGPSGSPSLDVNVRFQEAVALAPTNSVRAEAELKTIIEQAPDATGPYLNEAILAANAGRYSDAQALLQRALAHTPDQVSVLDEQGIVLRHLGQFTAAAMAYEAALKADPESVKARRNFGVLLDLYLGRSDEAVRLWKQAIEIEGTDKTLEGWIAEVAHRVPSPRSSGKGEPN